MPKTRKGRTQHSRKAKLTERTKEVLESQIAAFREKFGREPEDGEPIFFDPDEDQPVPLSAHKIKAQILEAMRKANTPPEIAYAYKRTGLLLTKDSRASAEARQEWDTAIQEYFAIEAASKLPDRPDPRIWNTEIPELLASPFSQKDLDQVMECMRVIAPIEEKGMTVVTRMELAAAFLAAACSSAFDSAAEMGDDPAEGPDRYAMAEEVVVKRARELYGQGRL
jgi:hypothetical protein